jgi:Domain of unknown function (DUF3576)
LTDSGKDKNTMNQRILATALVLTVTALGVAACGGGKSERAMRMPESRISTIGVNSYLWRAAVETLSFMPMTQVDANAGVLLSDWYVNPRTPDERVKVSVFVLDKDLRADALRVSAQRQQGQGGVWQDATVRAGTVQKLEDAILARARQIRQASVGVEEDS